MPQVQSKLGWWMLAAQFRSMGWTPPTEWGEGEAPVDDGWPPLPLGIASDIGLAVPQVRASNV